ncbi:LLM class flavin-dependent oxidoreductase [Siminovitchia sediminis]|uniref:LLM class flavin-dependent oxidoreductase n=1 Tax=Siminovitchia sediminis TaxID=1274353 RepID=A0ABW4KKM2_9BACI
MEGVKKLELGVFIPSTNNGWIMSKNSPKFMPTFELNKSIALLAEEIGFDHVFSAVKWRGFGGETEHSDYAVEPMTLMAGIAAITKRVKIIASIQPLTFNPVVAAKMMVTLDEISKGRFGLNLVSGQYFDEYKQMGVMPEGYPSYRYEFAQEWLDIVKKLWTEDHVTYKGKFHTIEDVSSKPKPIQKPFPSIVCAGMSETGLNFTAKNGSHSFVSGRNFAEMKAMGLKAKETAKKYGRTIKTNTVFIIIQADTDKEAKELEQYYRDGADVELLSNIMNIYSKDASGSASQMLAENAKKHVFYGFPPISGSPETIASILEEVHREGEFDGILFTFPEYLEGMRNFNEKVRPLLLEKGVKLTEEHLLV